VSIYHAMLGNDVSGGESSMEFTWSLVNLAAHLAQTVRYFDSTYLPGCQSFLTDWTT
jgi:hypothetical protein